METEVVNTLDYDEHEEDRRDVKVKRTVVKVGQYYESSASLYCPRTSLNVFIHPIQAYN